MAEPMHKIDLHSAIAVLLMGRPAKRNAMRDELLDKVGAFFSTPPEGAKVVVLVGTAGHFCSGQILGADRMIEMMLKGRKFLALKGHAAFLEKRTLSFGCP